MQAVLPGIKVAETSSVEGINLRINRKYLLALFALMICTGELHEQIHIQTGYLICGNYGPRDFNAWRTAEDCGAPAWAFLATLVGPLWSYLVMWTGAFLLVKAKSASYKTIGFSLIFAPLPFARIFTAMMGGGDERSVLRALLQNDLSPGATKVLAAIVVTAICLPPIFIAFKHIKNRFAVLYVIGFCVLPLIVLGIYVLTLLNGLLARGFLSSAPVLGTPLLIIFHFLIAAIFLFFSRKWLFEISRKRF